VVSALDRFRPEMIAPGAGIFAQREARGRSATGCLTIHHISCALTGAVIERVMAIRNGAGPVSREVADAALGDTRLTSRLVKIVDRLEAQPGQSFPKALVSEAELEGCYRFFQNPRVLPDRILQPHAVATIGRCREAGRVLVVHDTSTFEFSGEAVRRGLGPLRGQGQGFLGHFSLAIDSDGQPLGVLAMKTWMRRVGGHGARTVAQRRKSGDNENDRWADVACDVEASLEGVKVTHVMDREADAYALLAKLQGSSYVVRAQHDRVVDLPQEAKLDSHERLRQIMARSPVILTREVPLSARRNSKAPPVERRVHPPRSARIAKLAISAMAVTIRRSACTTSVLPATLVVNVVRVVEIDVPLGEPPVEWLLLTNEPITTPDEVGSVIDTYRRRWIIEEFFKALKTGCRYEERQLEQAHALLNALATFVPVAWQMLLLRHVSRQPGTVDALAVATPRQIAILRSVPHLKLPSQPTARDFLFAIAALGGHIKNNGEPGWQVLARGFHDLRVLETGWAAGATATTVPL
jgi:hypothetical protein